MPGDKIARLAALGFCTGNEHFQAQSHHFIDVDGDGQPDVIYSGMNWDCNGYGEGQQTRIYLALHDRLAEIFSSSSEIVGMWRAAPWQPLYLVLRQSGCCGDIFITTTYMRPVLQGDSVRYEAYDAISSIYRLVWPRRWWPQPRAFHVVQDRYYLRAAPVIDDSTRGRLTGYDADRGNAIAEYASGATGLAFAAQTDSTGRNWFFVLTDLGSRPVKIVQVDSAQLPNLPPSRYFGWMSARHLSVDSVQLARPSP